MPTLPKKIALVHDWLAIYTGSERVVEQILTLYPDADLFSLVEFLPAGQRDFIRGKAVKTSFMQHLPLARRHFRSYLPLMPIAIEQFDLTGYDLVISSSHAVAKGVITGPNQLHVSYIHSPIRYAWDMQHEYLREARLDRGLRGWLGRWLLHYIRLWDARTMNGVDAAATNSHFIARRIWKIYRREAEVIYPPVDTHYFQCQEKKEDFYLAVGRMVPYKKAALIVQAFAAMPDKQLVIIGDGPELNLVRRLATANIRVLGYQPTEVVADYMRRARAFLFAAQEDFGITPVEAQACGTPVIAYGAGGAAETIRGLEQPEPTGVFFDAQTVEAIQAAVGRFEEAEALISPAACRKNAERFSVETFRQRFSAFVINAWQQFNARQYPP